MFTTYAAGVDLAATPGATVTVTVSYVADQRSAWNVLAETDSGNDDNVVMAGAHLDSVQEGAGINDNGSGSAALLETAIQMAKVKTANTVRFAWWGAEESGLLGSEYYVENLSRGRGGTTSRSTSTSTWSPRRTTCSASTTATTRAAPRLRASSRRGSAEIEDVFERFYAERGEPSQDSEFSGRSDYGPFIAVDIPAGGLFTGAEVPKTAAEAALYGGVAGAAYDPCYHSFCDNLRGDGQNVALYNALREDYELVGNINVHALDVNSDAIATAVLTFAYDTSTVNGVAGKPGKSKGLYKSEKVDPMRDALTG